MPRVCGASVPGDPQRRERGGTGGAGAVSPGGLTPWRGRRCLEAGRRLPRAWLEPTWARWVPGSRFQPQDSCRVKTVILLRRNASRCFMGTLDFGVAVLNWFILLNYQVTTHYYTQNTKTENKYPPPNPLKYSVKLKYQ